MSTAATFDAACNQLETILRDDTRSEILNNLCKSKTLSEAVVKLRASMASHQFKAGSRQINLAELVNALDKTTREDGFTVLIDWDGKANKWLTDLIPIDVLNYFLKGIPSESIGRRERKSLSILLDYYLLYIVALLAMRVGDGSDVPANVDRVTGLIADLQGPAGSGQRCVNNTGALILIATAHYEPDETAYERLIARIRSMWSTQQQIDFALVHAAVLGSHLRHGFRDVYVRDLGKMRADNGPDYPCLLFALLTLMREYARMHDNGIQGIERGHVVESLLNGLTPDPRAFIGKPPASLANYLADQNEFATLFKKHREDLMQEFEAHRPSEHHYSPIAFAFNFPHNLVKGIIVDALFNHEPTTVSVNELLTGIQKVPDARESLARSLMGYARRAPDQVDNRVVPVIEYDPLQGMRSFTKTLSTIRELVA